MINYAGHGASDLEELCPKMSALPKLHLDFTGQPPIPNAGIERANELMRSGRLFRYGETEAGEHDVAILERRFADRIGRRYCVAFNSCGSSLWC